MALTGSSRLAHSSAVPGPLVDLSPCCTALVPFCPLAVMIRLAKAWDSHMVARSRSNSRCCKEDYDCDDAMRAHDPVATHM